MSIEIYKGLKILIQELYLLYFVPEKVIPQSNYMITVYNDIM